MLGGFEGNQRGVQPLPLPIGLPVAPTPGVAGDAVHKFVVPEVLRALVVISAGRAWSPNEREADRDRKSTRLNSSHSQISYAVFCLKKKKKKTRNKLNCNNQYN